jgi:tRNA-2-methylthio-N6-dimethylallyladenosine synthase
MGRTRTNKVVVFDGTERHIGEVLDVEITHTMTGFTLYGTPVG